MVSYGFSYGFTPWTPPIRLHRLRHLRTETLRTSRTRKSKRGSDGGHGPMAQPGRRFFLAFPRGVLLGDLLNKAFLTYNFDNYDNYMITMT